MSGPDARVPDAAIIGPSGEAGPDALRGFDRLLAIEEIRLTKARYCAAVDDHDWKALRSVFTDDCVIDWPLPGHKVETPDEFVSFLAGAMTQSIQTRHHVHNLQIGVHFGDGSHRALGPRELDLVRRRQQAEHSTVGAVPREVPADGQGLADRLLQRAKLIQFGPRRRSVVAPASAMATCEYRPVWARLRRAAEALASCLARRSSCSRRRSDAMLPPAKPAGTLLLARSTTSKCWINSSARTPERHPDPARNQIAPRASPTVSIQFTTPGSSGPITTSSRESALKAACEGLRLV